METFYHGLIFIGHPFECLCTLFPTITIANFCNKGKEKICWLNRGIEFGTSTLLIGSPIAATQAEAHGPYIPYYSSFPHHTTQILLPLTRTSAWSAGMVNSTKCNLGKEKINSWTRNGTQGPCIISQASYPIRTTYRYRYTGTARS